MNRSDWFAGTWLSNPTAGTATALRVFCLPHAGSGASAFRSWTIEAHPGVQVCPVQLPGRESRRAEPLPESLQQLATTLADVLLPYLDVPFALVGNSIGALIAAELAGQLRSRYLLSPTRLIVAGSRAPGVPICLPDLSALSDEALAALLHQQYGGIPQEALDMPGFLGHFMPVVRADLTMVGNYRPDPGALVLSCPVTALVGRHDRAVAPTHLSAWAQVTSGPVTTRVIDGGHFALMHHHGELLAALAAEAFRVDGGLTS